jgi:phosphoglycolate phosphatase-like HAD superfamily hydrolase
VIIVSNNSSYAIREYLAIHRIDPVAGVVGRYESDPALMKPSPCLVRAAVSILDAHPAECAFVGDSTTDMLAGRLAGVPVIGYANKPGKAELLAQAGAGHRDNRARRDHDSTPPHITTCRVIRV